MPTQAFAVLPDADLAEGQLRVVDAGPTKVLLVRDGGRVHATAATCPHYGLPLDQGRACGGRLRCPFHESAFDLATGEVREPPAFDGLAVYPVRVDGGQILVTVEDGRPAHVPPPDRSGGAADDRHVVVLGGGAAGNAAAEALREFGFAGRVTLVTAEADLPYDRPNLSKKYLAGQMAGGALPLRDGAYYAGRRIAVVHRTATGLDTATRTVRFADGELAYDHLILAVGSVAKPLDVPGAKLGNVFTLRTRADADRIIAAAAGARRAVCVGSSFIAMEVAACLTQRDLDVTVVSPSAGPFEPKMPKVGAYFRKLHEGKGVAFRFGSHVHELTGDGRRANGVLLADGERLPADLVVVGVGVRPATDFLPAAIRGDGGAVMVDESLAVPGTDGRVYAVGDIATYPDWMSGGRPTRIEHWRLAEQHGRHAAANIVGPVKPFREVPFFWTNQFGKSMDYLGHADRPDEVIVDGNVTGDQWLVYYVEDGRVAAAAGLQRKGDVTALMEVMRRVGRPSADGVRAGPVNWARELATVGCGTPAAGER